MRKTDNRQIEPSGAFRYFRKALQILLLNRSIMAEIATDPHALRFGLAVAACGGALTVLPRADLKAFVFFGFYSVASLFLFAGFIHIMAGYAKGKKHFMGLVKISAFASIIDWMAAVPILAILITIWGIAVAVVATEEIYEIKRRKALFCVFVAAGALWIVALLILTGPFGSLYIEPGAQR